MSEKLRIVVADDDAPVREILRQCLTDLGHDVVTVGGGRPLLDQCATAPPDVVVSDLRMPDLDGISAARAIRSAGATPVVLISGSWDPALRERAGGIGAVWCLDKPFQLRELVGAVAAAADSQTRSSGDGPPSRSIPTATMPQVTNGLIAASLLTLAPVDLPNFRSVRYSGGGLGVPVSQLAPDDQALIRHIYEAVLAVAAGRPEGDDVPVDPVYVDRVRAVATDGFIRAAQRLGEATANTNPGSLTLKVLHDLRGGALTGLVGTAELAMLGPPDAGLLATCGRLARDHCKIARNAMPDLDPPRRAHDERLNCHGVEEFVRTWDGATVCEFGREVAVDVTCAYRGGVTASCLENAAVGRVLYNHVNNAARFAADARVSLAIFGVGTGRVVRWVVSNTVTAEQRAWLAAAGPDLSTLYAGGLTNGGSGVGLASCRDFVSAAFGLPTAAAAVALGYLGARLDGDTYRAWFHWPGYAP